MLNPIILIFICVSLSKQLACACDADVHALARTFMGNLELEIGWLP